MAKNKVRCRSAIDGRFVTEKQADSNPDTTIKETIKKSKADKPKKR